VGTGDIKDELKKVYKEREYIYPYERNYNAHNQYLQTWAALGTIGLLSLLGIFGLCVLEGLFRGNYFFFLLTVNVAVACVTESILEVQAGVVFLTFFVALVAPVVTAIPRQKLSLFSKTA
jgi:O-antigen ligase